MRSDRGRKRLAQVPLEVRVFVQKYAEIVLRIHEILDQKGWTQKDLAFAMGKSPAELSRWLSGTGNLTLKSIAKLEAVLEEEIIEIPIEKSNSKALPVQKLSNTYPKYRLPSSNSSENKYSVAACPSGTMQVATSAA